MRGREPVQQFVVVEHVAKEFARFLNRVQNDEVDILGSFLIENEWEKYKKDSEGVVQSLELAGFAIVPKEPTDAMIAGADKTLAGGLMGQVISVTGGTSTVLLLTDPDHAVPVTVARNGVRLIVYGRGDTLELRDIPLSAGVEVGDEIVTSGLGGRFPAGFPVGTITGLRPDDTHAFLVGELKPAAQLDRGRDLDHLQEGDGALLHAGAARGGRGQQR